MNTVIGTVFYGLIAAQGMGAGMDLLETVCLMVCVFVIDVNSYARATK